MSAKGSKVSAAQSRLVALCALLAGCAEGEGASVAEGNTRSDSGESTEIRSGREPTNVSDHVPGSDAGLTTERTSAIGSESSDTDRAIDAGGSSFSDTELQPNLDAALAAPMESQS